MTYIIPVLILGGCGILAGVLLTAAAKIFYVEVDERVEKISEALPQANCGACGYAGCDGYAKALTEADTALEKFLKNMRDDDLLIITADHGCDPTTPSTDHSREYVPLLIYGKNLKHNINLKTITGFNIISKSILDLFNIEKCDESIFRILKK